MIAADTTKLLVYLPKKTRAAIDAKAKEEGISSSAVARRELVRVFGPVG